MQKKPSLHSVIFSIFLISLIFTRLSFSQPTNVSPPEATTHEEVTVLSSKCDVYLKGVKLKNVRLTFHSDSSLIAVKGTQKREVLYTEITQIVFRSHEPFGSGFVKGAAAGFAIGFLKSGVERGGFSGDLKAWVISAVAGLTLSVPGGLIGGVIGMLFSSDEKYTFEKNTQSFKVEKINHIIHKHGALKY